MVFFSWDTLTVSEHARAAFRKTISALRSARVGFSVTVKAYSLSVTALVLFDTIQSHPGDITTSRSMLLLSFTVRGPPSAGKENSLSPTMRTGSSDCWRTITLSLMSSSSLLNTMTASLAANVSLKSTMKWNVFSVKALVPTGWIHLQLSAIL